MPLVRFDDVFYDPLGYTIIFTANIAEAVCVQNVVVCPRRGSASLFFRTDVITLSNEVRQAMD
jgi:hypothetical protein